MAEENQIGKIFIPRALHEKDNRFGDDRYDRGGAFIEDFQPNQWLEFCSRWLHLAGYADLVDDIKEYYETIGTLSSPMTYTWDNGIPLIPALIKDNDKLPVGFSKVVNNEKPFIKYKQPYFDKVYNNYYERQIKMPGGVY